MQPVPVEERKPWLRVIPKYNQGDILGYRDCFYVITEVEGDHYAGYIAGKGLAVDVGTRFVNKIIDIDDEPQIRLVVRGRQ